MSLLDRIEAAEREHEREQRGLRWERALIAEGRRRLGPPPPRRAAPPAPPAPSPPYAEIDLAWKLVFVVACAAVLWWLAP